MSYAVASALQAAVYQAIQSDAVIIGLVDTSVYDSVPSGTPPALYISLGPEVVTDASDKSCNGAQHKFTVTVHAEAPGFAAAKVAAAAVCDALIDADLTLTRGRLVFLRFDRATATRTDAANGRKIDLRFVARVEDS